jgi:G3E family GTPase
MKYKLLKKIEGYDLEVGNVYDFPVESNMSVLEVIREIKKAEIVKYTFSKLDLHNLLLNGTIEKVEENERWKPEGGSTYYRVGISFEGIGVRECENWNEEQTELDFQNYNCFRTEQEAQQVADQIKELLKKHHEHITRS